MKNKIVFGSLKNLKNKIIPLIISSCFLLYGNIYSQSEKNNLQAKKTKEFIQTLIEYEGVPYSWGGRSKKNIDCMGLVFLAYSKVTGKDWKKFYTDPVKLINKNQIGKPVKGLDGILREDLDKEKLDKIKAGDIIFFLTKQNIIPTPIKIKGENYYIWHMGVYIGKELERLEKENVIIHADPFDLKVDLDNLFEIPFEGIYVIRPSFE